MNILSNMCFGGHYYRHLGLPYENPFIWTAMSHAHFIEICRDYDKINFMNITGSRISGRKLDPGRRIPILTIDNRFELEYVHYLKRDSGSGVVRRGGELYSDDPLKTAVDTYLKRAERMRNSPPTFMFYYYDNPALGTSVESIGEFFSLSTPYERYLVTYFVPAIEYVLSRPEIDARRVAFRNIGNEQLYLVPHAEQKFNLRRLAVREAEDRTLRQARARSAESTQSRGTPR